MDISKLKRNAPAVHGILKKLKDGTVVTTKDCEIHIPTRYQDVGLATVANVIEYVSIYAIVVGGSYGISTTNAMVRSIPSDVRTETIEGEEYTVMMFTPGDVVFTDSNVVMLDTLVYTIWSEYIDKGKSTWFLEPDDINHLFLTAKSHSNARLGSNHAILEMIHSVRMRNDKDRTEHLRYPLNAGKKSKGTIIGLRNIQLTADTTSARIGGSYAEVGVSSAILAPADKAEGLEAILLT